MDVFQGRWICAPEFAAREPLHIFHREREPLEGYRHEEELKNRHMLVRRAVTLPCIDGYGDLRLRVTADDYYKLYVNGAFVGQGPAPGYVFAYYYNEWDLRPFLHRGDNLIELEVYYQGLINRVWNSGDYRQGLIADLIAGGRVLLSTDKSWEYAWDPRYVGRRTTGYETQYLEDVDSRRRVREEDWHPLCEKEADYRFCETPVTPLQITRREPVSIRPVEGGVLCDFGRELAGSLSLRVMGKAGRRLRLLCGEELDGDGRVRYALRCNCVYEEFWTLDDGENALTQYDYKGFRYAEILAEDGGALEGLSVSVLERHYPFDEGAFSLQSSDAALDAVVSLCKNTVKVGSQEVFVDCPTREKGQYSGDITITGAAHLLLTGDGSLLRKALENQAQSLRIAPGLLAVTPGSLMQEIADYSLQFPLSVWRYYRYTGDREFLRRMAGPCREVLAYFRRFSREDGLLEEVTEKWNLVDWPENLRDGYDFPLTIPVGPGCHTVINAFYVGAAAQVEQMERELGEPVSGEARRLREAFNRAFFRQDSGVYADSEVSGHASLPANCLPVFFGLHPAGSKDSLARLLVAKGLCGGVYMAFFQLKALAALGCFEEVYRLVTSPSANSWMHMIEEGATACFEAWGKEQKWNTSLCHPWASAPIPVLVEDLIGWTVQPDGSYRLQPHLPPSLSLEAAIPTPRGRFRFRWTGGRAEGAWEHEQAI